MSVHVVAMLTPDTYAPGESIPDGAGAWVKQFPDTHAANNWLFDPTRETYYAGDEEAILVFADTKGRVL